MITGFSRTFRSLAVFAVFAAHSTGAASLSVPLCTDASQGARLKKNTDIHYGRSARLWQLRARIVISRAGGLVIDPAQTNPEIALNFKEPGEVMIEALETGAGALLIFTRTAKGFALYRLEDRPGAAPALVNLIKQELRHQGTASPLVDVTIIQDYAHLLSNHAVYEAKITDLESGKFLSKAEPVPGLDSSSRAVALLPAEPARIFVAHRKGHGEQDPRTLLPPIAFDLGDQGRFRRWNPGALYLETLSAFAYVDLQRIGKAATRRSWVARFESEVTGRKGSIQILGEGEKQQRTELGAVTAASFERVDGPFEGRGLVSFHAQGTYKMAPSPGLEREAQQEHRALCKYSDASAISVLYGKVTLAGASIATMFALEGPDGHLTYMQD